MPSPFSSAWVCLSTVILATPATNVPDATTTSHTHATGHLLLNETAAIRRVRRTSPGRPAASPSLALGLGAAIILHIGTGQVVVSPPAVVGQQCTRKRHLLL